MRNLRYFGIIFSTAFMLSNCETRTYEEISEPTPVVATVNYNEHIKPIMVSSCTTCHATGGIVAGYPLQNYSQVKLAIDNIIDRIERPNGDLQKMPQGNSLSAAQINLIKQWKTDGLLEQ